MSKIGKKPIQIPKGAEVKVSGDSISVKGPKGELKRDLNSAVVVKVEGDNVIVGLNDKSMDKGGASKWGLFRALIANMIKGVTDGFEENLEFEGVGYKANVKPASPAGGGDVLELNLGYSHPISVKAPTGISFKVEKNVIKVTGIDNELVGHVAAEIKSKRLPEPYKGKGIRYSGEVIRRKAGKKAATAA